MLHAHGFSTGSLPQNCLGPSLDKKGRTEELAAQTVPVLEMSNAVCRLYSASLMKTFGIV
jgi:hypothetical protein